MIDHKLQKLRELVEYYNWKYECTRHIGGKLAWNDLVQAKKNLKEYKTKTYSATRFLTPSQPFLRMNDWAEQYENYAD
jgi:hypothetical protein